MEYVRGTMGAGMRDNKGHPGEAPTGLPGGKGARAQNISSRD